MLGLHPVTRRAQELLLDAAHRRGLPVRITSGFRSISEQRALYERWLRGDPRVITPAVPGSSTHNYGLAFDAVSPRQPELIALAHEIGLATIPTDPVHFQVVDPSDWHTALNLSPGNPLALLA